MKILPPHRAYSLCSLRQTPQFLLKLNHTLTVFKTTHTYQRAYLAYILFKKLGSTLNLQNLCSVETFNQTN
jgi:hypothetical protein